jgi:hypothetical protein
MPQFTAEAELMVQHASLPGLAVWQMKGGGE